MYEVDKGRDWSLTSGLVGFIMKNMLTDGSFIFCRNSLALGGAIPSRSAKPQISKHQKQMFNTRLISREPRVNCGHNHDNNGNEKIDLP